MYDTWKDLEYYRSCTQRNKNIQIGILQRDLLRLKDQKQISGNNTKIAILIIVICLISFLLAYSISEYFKMHLKRPSRCIANLYDITNNFSPKCQICIPGYKFLNNQCVLISKY